MVLLMEVIDFYNEFERKMQIVSYAVEAVDDSDARVYYKTANIQPMFGTDPDLAQWTLLNKVPKSDIDADEDFKQAIQEMNNLIDESTKIIEWGNHKYLLGDLKSTNHFNLKAPYRGQFNLERAYEALTGNKVKLVNAETRLAVLKIAYNKSKEIQAI